MCIGEWEGFGQEKTTHLPKVIYLSALMKLIAFMFQPSVLDKQVYAMVLPAQNGSA